MDLKDIEKSLDLLKQSVVPYDICVTLVDELHNQATIEELGEWIQGVDKVIFQALLKIEKRPLIIRCIDLVLKLF